MQNSFLTRIIVLLRQPQTHRFCSCPLPSDASTSRASFERVLSDVGAPMHQLRTRRELGGIRRAQLLVVDEGHHVGVGLQEQTRFVAVVVHGDRVWP